MLITFVFGPKEKFNYILGIAAIIYLYTDIDLKNKKSLSDLICIAFILFTIGDIFESLFYKILNSTDWHIHSSSLGAEVFAKTLKFLPLTIELINREIPEDNFIET